MRICISSTSSFVEECRRPNESRDFGRHSAFRVAQRNALKRNHAAIVGIHEEATPTSASTRCDEPFVLCRHSGYTTMLHIVLIDNKRLRVLQRDAQGRLTEIYASENRESVAHERDARADRAGRVVNASSGARVTLDPRSTARSLSLQRWIKTIGIELQEPLAESTGYVLVASTRLLGLLRVSLPMALRRKLLVEVGRDLTKQTPAALEKRLRSELQEALLRVRERPNALARHHRAGI